MLNLSLIEQIQQLMLANDDDQSERLEKTYRRASPAQRKVIDECFVCLCGYSLDTILAGDA